MLRVSLQKVLKLSITTEKLYYSTASKLRETDINNIRNIGILAHIDAGTS